MEIHLEIGTKQHKSILPLNYQYPLDFGYKPFAIAPRGEKFIVPFGIIGRI